MRLGHGPVAHARRNLGRELAVQLGAAALADQGTATEPVISTTDTAKAGSIPQQPPSHQRRGPPHR